MAAALLLLILLRSHLTPEIYSNCLLRKTLQQETFYSKDAQHEGSVD
jgi:hypothetical protein